MGFAPEMFLPSLSGAEKGGAGRQVSTHSPHTPRGASSPVARPGFPQAPSSPPPPPFRPPPGAHLPPRTPRGRETPSPPQRRLGDSPALILPRGGPDLRRERGGSGQGKAGGGGALPTLAEVRSSTVGQALLPDMGAPVGPWSLSPPAPPFLPYGQGSPRCSLGAFPSATC